MNNEEEEKKEDENNNINNTNIYYKYIFIFSQKIYFVNYKKNLKRLYFSLYYNSISSQELKEEIIPNSSYKKHII